MEWSYPTDSTRYQQLLENERVVDFLASLNKKHDDVRGWIIERELLPNFQAVFSKVFNEGTCRTLILTNIELSMENSMLASKSFESSGEKWNDKKTKKKSWHTQETCWKLHGKPLN